MAEDKKIDVSVWLVPEESQLRGLQKTVDELAEKYGACSFVPHLTLYHLGTDVEVSEVLRVLGGVLGRAEKVRVTAMEVGFSDNFTQTLFVRYEAGEEMRRLYERLKEEWGEVHDYELNPHLSLIYSTKMSEEEKQLEAGRVEYPELEMDRVVVIVREGGAIEKEVDVADWKAVQEFDLGVEVE
jgi:2'-5' RNA ligase